MKKNLLGISLITMSCLYGLLAIILIIIAVIFKFPIEYALLASIGALIIQFLISPFITDLTMRLFYGARFDMSMPDYLVNFINGVCTNHKMKYPRIGYIDDGAPNAFTYGHTKNNARVILTRGIFDLLSEEEVKAVVAHELGHASHYDMLFMTVAQLVPLVLYGVYEAFANNTDDDSNNNLALIGMLAYVLYIISQYIILWLSRNREYYADYFAVVETRNPSALAEALVKVGLGLSTGSVNNDPNNQTKRQKRHSVARSNALGIFDSKTSKTLVVSSYNQGVIDKSNIQNAMKWEMWNVWAKFYELNSTHPLVSKRIKAISNMCPAYNQAPYLNFNLEKKESYIDDFLGEIFIWVMPTLMIIFTFVLAMLFADKNIGFIIGLGGILTMTFSFVKLFHSHKNRGYQQTNVSSLLSEVKVSGVTCVPCILNGEIIGRGNPGCILNEDFVLKDESGIMLLDYNQPLNFINKLFAIFRSPQYFNKKITVKGWYRRSPVPFVEVYTMEIDGKIKKTYTFGLSKFWRSALMILFIAILVMSIL